MLNMNKSDEYNIDIGSHSKLQRDLHTALIQHALTDFMLQTILQMKNKYLIVKGHNYAQYCMRHGIIIYTLYLYMSNAKPNIHKHQTYKLKYYIRYIS